MSPKRIFILGFMLFNSSLNAAESSQAVGLVTSATGKWIDHEGSGVRRGSAVWSDSRLRLDGPGDRSEQITIRSFVNGQSLTLRCGDTDCESPLNLLPVVAVEKGAEPSGSLLVALRSVISDLFSAGEANNVAAYGHGLSKGANGSLTDAIVAIKGSGLDLTPVFRDMDAGTFAVSFCPVAKDGSAHCADVERNTWIWQPRDTAAFQTGSLKPGLYEIAAYAQAQDGMAPIRESAMVLAVPPSAFEAAQRSYSGVMRETANWDRGEQVIARRVYLQYLSSRLGR